MTTAAGALGHGWGVDRLVPGDPLRIRVLAANLAQYAEVTADAAAGLSRLDPEWTGPAYTAFWTSLTDQRQGFLDASNAFNAASLALDTYANEVAVAKVDAGTARTWWEQGMDSARAWAMDEFLAGRSYPPPVAGDNNLTLAFSPAGAGLRAAAAEKLDGAWAAVDSAARAAIRALVDAQAKAPQAPHWWDTAAPKVTGLFGLGDNSVKREFAAGVVRGLIDMGTTTSSRSIKAALDASLDGWEKSQGINPDGGIHGIGGFASGMLIPGFGAAGLAAGLAAKLANRSLTRIVEEGAATVAAGAAGKAAGADTATVALRLVNGRRPINSDFAGKVFGGPTIGPDTPPTWTPALAAKYPNGVRFTAEGFPDFTPYAQVSVEVKGLTGTYRTDERLANAELAKIASLPTVPRTPTGYVWHHVEDANTMLLLPKDIHDAVKHTGGAALLKGKP